jgi:2-polyprenyl-3-methyl-5-hydroxy-6-metoxy-1,4-benzoquinol methylase
MKKKNKELFYNGIAYEWEEKIFKPETEKRLNVVYKKILNPISAKGKKFLDIGCGLGFFSSRAGKLGAKVYGIDIGGNLVKISKSRYPKGKFSVASAERLPFKDDSFDMILCTEVIEHVNNQKKVINEIFRVLKQGGHLIITTPNRIFEPLYSLMCSIGIRPYHGNEYWFYPWDIIDALEVKGRVIKKYYFNFIYPHPFLDKFEKYHILKYFMLHQGYLVIKE